MANRRTVAAALTLSLVVSLVGADAFAASVQSFYKQKKRATTIQAFERAERRLESVTPGMSERKFLRVMDLQILTKRGKTLDVSVDGYLANASADTNQPWVESGVRAMAFGYLADGEPQVRFVVLLRDGKVDRIERPVANLARLKANGSDR